MYALAELTADQVLQAFRRDGPSLFLGAMITAVGLVAVAFYALRRKHDPILVYFAFFAALYGLRMWIKADLMSLSMQDWPVFAKLKSAIDFVVPIPAFLFFNAAGLLQRWSRIFTHLLGIVFGVFALATLAIGARSIFYEITGVLVIAALAVLVVRSARTRANQDFVVVRRGLVVFVAFAVWENIRGMLNLRLPNVEPIGFVAFLLALGYVAARQTLVRDQHLSEIQKELEVAKKIQMSILPPAFPDSATFRVAARYVPMTSVAGDFYDFIVADDTRAGLLIADVSGHGVPAALIASMVKVAATSQQANLAHPSRLLAGMNAVLCGNTQDQFVTAAYVYLDSQLQELRYSAAGHPPMLLLRDGEVREIVENGLMLAAFGFATYTTATQKLQPGDRLLLYTDGIVEAAKASGEFFGAESLSTLLRQTSGIAPSDAADRIISTVQQWAESQEDDLTVLVCDYTRDAPRAAN